MLLRLTVEKERRTKRSMVVSGRAVILFSNNAVTHTEASDTFRNSGYCNKMAPICRCCGGEKTRIFTKITVQIGKLFQGHAVYLIKDSGFCNIGSLLFRIFVKVNFLSSGISGQIFARSTGNRKVWISL